MTKCIEQVRPWHVWRWGCHWGFPTSAAQDHPLGLQLSTACGTVGVGVAARDDLRSHHRRFGLLLRRPPHAVHLALRLPDEQVASTTPDEVLRRSHDQLLRSDEPHSRDGDHRSCELGWLENGLDFHVSKDEGGVEGQIGGPGLERHAQSATDLVDEGARQEGCLARAHLGHRRVRSRGGGAAQNATWAADHNQEEDAQGPVLQEVRCGHEQDRQSVAHAECLARSTRLKAFRTTIGMCLPGKHAGRSLT